MNILEGEKVALRPIEPNDAEIIHQWENNTSIWEVSNTIMPFAKHVIEMYVQTATQDIYQTRQLRLIIEINSEEDQELRAIGCIDLFDFDPVHQRAGVGILIHNKDDRMKGYATDALEIIKKYAFKVLHLNQLYCNILNDNTESIGLFQKQGFELIGKKKQWVKSPKGWKDELMFQFINNSRNF